MKRANTKNLKELLFGNSEEVMVVIYPERVEKAEEIFAKYNGKRIDKTGVSHNIFPGGVTLEIETKESEKPDKIRMVYLINKNHFESLFHDFYEEDIAGMHRHNKILHKPYSLKNRPSMDHIKRRIKFSRGYMTLRKILNSF
ncbi:MAG: hypothetical protein PHH54_04430 [Candidatus Nanoarchaeia archaeon]|nr:hypothetical protein [Candidatus Nanoarchaeia archaeon]MDD5741207.1 hypothetical protein [Candidatus Nanoarchaeia archaeon]